MFTESINHLSIHPSIKHLSIAHSSNRFSVQSVSNVRPVRKQNGISKPDQNILKMVTLFI